MSNPILVEIYRDQVLESFHRGAVCVVDREGKIIYSAGNIDQVCYPRSAMKLLQVLPLIAHGGMEHFGFTLEEIAVMCGSHNAEAEHLRVIRSILQKIGMSEDQLQCGPQYPTSKKDAEALIKKDEKPKAIHNNCSGKHAGMLAMCALMGWPADTYIDPQHPLQQMILGYCAELYEYPADHMITALDGCSAPVFSVPVYQQAIGYKNLVSTTHVDAKRQGACRTVIEAVSRYPFLVAGSKRYCTDMMQVCAPQVIGKTGAEGIFCMALPEQEIGVCIKIDDGKMLPQYNVAQAFIEATGLFSKAELSALHHYQESELKNFNKLVTGSIRTAAGLFDGFSLA